MTKHIFTLLAFFIILGCNPKAAKEQCNTEEIQSLETTLRTQYSKEPVEALKTMHSLLYLYTCSNAAHHKLANTYLNLGTLYDEKFDKLDSSILFLTKADSVFQSYKDTMGWANILKFQGLVEVRNGDPDGIQKILKGKKLYEQVNFMQGRMVSQQNEAKARFYLQDFNLADSLLLPCLSFWNTKHIRFQQVFYDLIEVHQKLNDCDSWRAARNEIMKFTNMLSVENQDKISELNSSLSCP